VIARLGAGDGRLLRTRRRRCLAAIAIGGAIAVVASLLSTGPLHANAAPKIRDDSPTSRPNIVFITTDDMRLSDMAYMPNVKRLLAARGVTFTHALSPHPLCCPARAVCMTGLYGQNNGVHHNVGVHGGFHALIDPGNNLGTWLQKAGYQTAMSGKFMNGYTAADGKQAGWTHWNPSVRGVYAYRDTTFFDDGTLQTRTGNTDDAIVRYTTSYIRAFARSDKPFMVWASHLSPHDAATRHRWGPPIPAVRHRNLFDDAVNPSTKSPSYLPAGRTRTGLTSAGLTHWHRQRIRSLQSVDEGVRSIVDTLRKTGELSNTYIIFTSDNGYLLGEHNRRGKNNLYDEALRVPLIVRLPGSHAATRSNEPVTLVDVAPTISDIAGATPTRLVDGTSFEQTLTAGSQRWRSAQLVQTGRPSQSLLDPGWALRGIRTGTWTYWRSERTGRETLFNRRRDPFEMTNVARRQPRIVKRFRAELPALENCAGAACSVGVR
jgi:arylsulfatase A-like enzyme